jgi:hypothetical protein
MGISEAIARVRQSAIKSNLLDGALSYLGVRIKADLVVRLKSDSVPPPLRPLATRLASMIKLSDPPPYDPSAARQLEVVSLDRALARAAAQQQRAAPATPHASPATAPQPAADVCPFTGLRADGSVADASAAPGEHAASPAGVLEVGNFAGATRLPIPTAANDASSVVPTAVASGADLAPSTPAMHGGPAMNGASSAVSAKPKRPAAKRPSNPPAAHTAGEKSKEKLAAPQDLTNTSARSATRPAKQPSGKGQTSSRKRRDSGL